VAPRKPNPIKQSTYECGIETVGDSWVQFKAQYYIFALVFLIFDVETVFLFPWALSLKQLPLFVVLEGVLFIAILVVGLVYAWRKGMLEWA
ncbi:MAG: NADH-quinone oxidoreductase subunit A, partial [Chloroflexi bacterium]|nr:NADH-quinone oxidoreductase subunit A [Chloroflexota bacterium]